MLTIFDPLLRDDPEIYGVGGALLSALAGVGDVKVVEELGRDIRLSASELVKAYLGGEVERLASLDEAAAISVPSLGAIEKPSWFPVFNYALAAILGQAPLPRRARVVIEAPRSWRDDRVSELVRIMPLSVKWRPRTRPRAYIVAGRVNYEVPLDLAPSLPRDSSSIAKIVRVYNTAAYTAVYLAARGTLNRRYATQLAEAMVPPSVAEKLCMESKTIDVIISQVVNLAV